MQSYELCSDMIDVVIDVSCIYGTDEAGTAPAYDSKSSSIMRLNNGLVLYLREVNKYVGGTGLYPSSPPCCIRAPQPPDTLGVDSFSSPRRRCSSFQVLGAGVLGAARKL